MRNARRIFFDSAAKIRIFPEDDFPLPEKRGKPF